MCYMFVRLGYESVRQPQFSSLPQERSSLAKYLKGGPTVAQTTMMSDHRSTPAGTVVNRMLVALPPADREQLMAMLEPVALPTRTTLFEAGKIPRYVHFLTSGIASLVTEMAVGEGVEVGISGREGMPECLHLLGPEMGESRCFMQVPGTGLRMSYPKFQKVFQENDAIRTRVLQYVQCQSLIMGQIAACNRLHGMEERLARWLLMVADRTGRPDMELTQEFLAEMLGSRRSTVTLTAGALQRSGVIHYQRGRIEIVDREGLTQVACECLPMTQRLLKQLYV